MVFEWPQRAHVLAAAFLYRAFHVMQQQSAAPLLYEHQGLTV